MAKKSKVALKASISLFVPTGEVDEETGEEIREEKKFPVRWNRRAIFRMSEAGYEKQVDGKDFAFMVTLVWACIDISKGRPEREDVADYIPEDEAKAEKVFSTVLGLINDSDTGKKG
jgi:hypothetical protein